VAKVGTSNQDRTISLKAAMRSCIDKQGRRLRWAVHVQVGYRAAGCFELENRFELENLRSTKETRA
jgi:hypothetical protein